MGGLAFLLVLTLAVGAGMSLYSFLFVLPMPIPFFTVLAIVGGLEIGRQNRSIRRHHQKIRERNSPSLSDIGRESDA